MGHVMVDIESLGIVPGSAILSVGAVYFGDEGLGAEFYRTVDLFDSLMHGLTIDVETVGWWRDQTPAARAVASDAGARRSLGDALHEFARFIDVAPGAHCLWAKGPDFDLVMLQAAYRAAGLKRPWSFRHARDVRTAVAMARGVAFGAREQKHHALEDAKYQAEQIRIVYKHLNLRLDDE